MSGLVPGSKVNVIVTLPSESELEKKIINQIKTNSRIHFLGRVDQNDLPALYSAADISIVPSTAEEGFGRVIMESLACSTPVIASNRGAIPEVINDTVGRLININPQSIRNSVEDFYLHPSKLTNLSKNTRRFAERRYSDKNAETIINALTH